MLRPSRRTASVPSSGERVVTRTSIRLRELEKLDTLAEVKRYLGFPLSKDEYAEFVASEEYRSDPAVWETERRAAIARAVQRQQELKMAEEVTEGEDAPESAQEEVAKEAPVFQVMTVEHFIRRKFAERESSGIMGVPGPFRYSPEYTVLFHERMRSMGAVAAPMDFYDTEWSRFVAEEG